jgi:transcriptional regulator with XRE-family HTH domain
MVNPFDETPAEKEQCVIDMLERGYSYKQIMKECHVSPSTISSIKKKVIGSEYDETSKVAAQISKETQALKLFSEGKTLLQVATDLDIAADFVFVIYQNFQRLRNMEAFISSYEQVKGNIQPFLHLFDLMNGLGMTPEQVAQQADYGTRLPYLGNIRLQLSNQVQALESQKQYLHLQLNFARSQLEQSEASLGFYNNECEKKRDELSAIHSELNTRKNFIQDFDNDEGYNRIKEAAKEETKLLMQNNQVACAVTLTATLEAIRRYPDNQILISDIVTSRNYSTTSYQQPWMELHAPKLLQLMQNVQNEIAERITGMVVRSMK